MPTQPLTRAEVRDIDVRACRDYGIPGLVLMENAGRSVAELLLSLGINGPVAIVAGKGNNGGDGAVIARHLKNRKIDVRFLLVADPAELTGDALVNYRILQQANWAGECWGKTIDSDTIADFLAAADWIVDALLGTGSSGAPREPYSTLIRAMNTAVATSVGTKILAVDIPTGLDCDTGIPSDPCIRAQRTATFVASKTGFANPAAAPYLGTVHILDIGIPQTMLDPKFAPGPLAGK